MALGEGRARWAERWEADPELHRQPSAWIVEQFEAHLAPGTVIVDLAGGNGRHARAAAALGLVPVLVDYAEVAVRQGWGSVAAVRPVVSDIWSLPFREAALPAICVVNFLERALFGSLIQLLQPNGLLFYETYTSENAAIVRTGGARAPRSQHYMLSPGELRELVKPLTILEYREGLVEDPAGIRHVASVVAEKQVEGHLG